MWKIPEKLKRNKFVFSSVPGVELWAYGLLEQCSTSTRGKGKYISKRCRRLNMAEILCIHV
jgi:hypothetical protein